MSSRPPSRRQSLAKNPKSPRTQRKEAFQFFFSKPVPRKANGLQDPDDFFNSAFAADDDLSDSGVSEYEEIVEEEVDASVDDWALSRPDSSESNKRWSSISGQATRWASTPTSRSSRRNSFASRLGSPESAIGDVFEDSFAEPSIGDELMDIDKTPEAPNLDLSDASSPRKKGRASTTPAPKATKSVGSTKKADSPSKAQQTSSTNTNRLSGPFKLVHDDDGEEENEPSPAPSPVKTKASSRQIRRDSIGSVGSIGSTYSDGGVGFDDSEEFEYGEYDEPDQSVEMEEELSPVKQPVGKPKKSEASTAKTKPAPRSKSSRVAPNDQGIDLSALLDEQDEIAATRSKATNRNFITSDYDRQADRRKSHFVERPLASPPTPDPHATRRSKRKRTAPVEYWRGERPVYEGDIDSRELVAVVKKEGGRGNEPLAKLRKTKEIALDEEVTKDTEGNVIARAVPISASKSKATNFKETSKSMPSQSLSSYGVSLDHDGYSPVTVLFMHAGQVQKFHNGDNRKQHTFCVSKGEVHVKINGSSLYGAAGSVITIQGGSKSFTLLNPAEKNSAVLFYVN